MATVTGLTKERMLQIEAESIVGGEVVGDNLYLTKHDGTSINAGHVRGSQGDSSSPAQRLQVVQMADYMHLAEPDSDHLAFAAAFAAARDSRLPIWMDAEREYKIKTDTMLSCYTDIIGRGSRIIFDESLGATVPGIRIRSYNNSIALTPENAAAIGSRIKPRVDKIPALAGMGRCLVHLYNADKQVHGRRLTSDLQAEDQMVPVIVDNQGRVQSTVYQSMSKVTHGTIWPLDHRPLTVSDLVLHSTNLAGGSSYVQRNLQIDARSGVNLSNVIHTVDEAATKAPHVGMFNARNSSDIVFEDCVGHPFNSIGSDGIYDVNISKVLGFTMRGFRAQDMDPDNSDVWGVMGSYSCQDVLIDDCWMNRIDAHRDIDSLTVRNSRLGGKGVSVTGRGQLVIRDVWCNAPTVIRLRDDYGSSWDGSITVDNVTHVPPPGSDASVVDGRLFGNHPLTKTVDYLGFGKDRVTVRDYTLDAQGAIQESPIFRIESRSESAYPAADQVRYQLPRSIIVENAQMINKPNPRAGLYFAVTPGTSHAWFGGQEPNNPQAQRASWLPNVGVRISDFDSRRPDVPNGNGTIFSSIGGLDGTYADDPLRALWSFEINNTQGLLFRVGHLPFDLTVIGGSIAQILGTSTRSRIAALGTIIRPYMNSSSQDAFDVPAEVDKRISGSRFERPTVASANGGEDLISPSGSVNAYKGIVDFTQADRIVVNAAISGCTIGFDLKARKPDLDNYDFIFGNHAMGQVYTV